MTIVTELSHTERSQPINATFIARLANKLNEKYGKTLKEMYPKENAISITSKCIAACAISYFARIDDESAAKCVCDGTDDGGIDALYVSKSNKILIVVQAKYDQDGKGTWKKKDLEDFQKACTNLLDFKFKALSPKFKEIQDEISTALSSDYKIYFVMAHTGNSGGSELVLNEMKEWQLSLDRASFSTEGGDSYFQVHLFSRDDIGKTISQGDQASVDLKDVKIYSYGSIENPYRSFFGYVDGKQIREWYQNYNTFLFNKNIRGFLGETSVNLSIQNTLDKEPEAFWYMNNGITILAKDIISHPRNAGSDSNGIFTLKDISIVNGAQTVSSIAKNTSESLELENVKVSIKVIKVESSELIQKITIATNHQNSVSGRDFASQDIFQQELAKQISIEGYNYNLLRTDSNINYDKEIDIDEALDAIVCFKQNISHIGLLKSNRGRFYEGINKPNSTLYRTIFNNSITGAQVVNLVKINRLIDSIRNKHLNSLSKNTKEYKIIVHCNRIISSLILNSILNGKDIQRKVIDIHTGISDHIQVEYDKYSKKIIDYVSKLNGIHIPRFFENKEKLSDLLNEI